MWFDLLSGHESREIGLGCSIGVHAREFRLTYDDLALEVSVLRLPKIVHESGEMLRLALTGEKFRAQQSLSVFGSSQL